MTAILGRTVKLIAAPIGLVSEAVHHRKDKKAAGTPASEEKSQESREDSNSPVYVNIPADQAEALVASKQAVPADGETATHELVPADGKDIENANDDEYDWALDDATIVAEEGESEDSNEKQEQTLKQTSAPKTLPSRTSSKSQSNSEQVQALPFPVVLPQRRPRTKRRGFVHAYAPVLEGSGIDQDMFLVFIQDFHKAAQASPIFDVIIVATAVASAYPDPLVGLGIQAVQIIAAIGQEAQERYRTNNFLDQANKDIFMPRGLLALIVTFVPGEDDETVIKSEPVDIGASTVATYGESLIQTEAAETDQTKPRKMDRIREKAKYYRIASGKTYGEGEMPTICAPLIFPTLDAIADDEQGRKEGFTNDIKAKTKHSSQFVANYFDQRAQASYVSFSSLPFQVKVFAKREEAKSEIANAEEYRQSQTPAQYIHGWDSTVQISLRGSQKPHKSTLFHTHHRWPLQS